MTVRIGVDVGGTFTKAVACETSTGEVVARSAVPTSHTSVLGVAEGVVQAVSAVASEVSEPIALVAHSTTQAVNALLEGDTSTVGVLGIGRRPDLKRAHKRTQVGGIRLAPGRSLATVHGFVDGSDGVDRKEVIERITRLVDRGAQSIVVSEAFGVDDARGEFLALETARDFGLPACAGHELSGLYGLELRTITAAINASILPTALKTARVVEKAVRADVPGVPLLVMRGDGGAADLHSMRRHPLVTAFSGPAASVAGALRHLSLRDGVVVEVGGTSTNVSLVKGGRPVLAYVRVLEHVTCVRSLDVRVVGVAGGSLLRVVRRLGRNRIDDVGPRSAHIAGLTYCSFEPPRAVAGAEVRLVAPRPGDQPEYVVLENRDGTRFALTPTCAANALGEVAPGSYARGNSESARLGFEALGRFLGCDWNAAARRTIETTARKISAVVADALRERTLDRPTVAGLGGGAGALVPELGRQLGLDWHIPADAEVISSVGDALSLVRAEVERTLSRPSVEAIARVHREAEEAAISAGASPASIQVESESVPERGALRVVASGAVALDADAAFGEQRVDEETLQIAAKSELGEGAHESIGNGFFTVFEVARGNHSRYAVFDRHGSLALEGEGVVIHGVGRELASTIAGLLRPMVRRLGPISVAPAVRVLRGARLVDLSLVSAPERAVEAAASECLLAGDDVAVIFASRS